MTPPAKTPTAAPARPRVASWLRKRRQGDAAVIRAGEAVGERAAGVAASGVSDRARGRVGLLAFTGIGLLLASELVERLERLEGDVGPGALNLIAAMMIATIVVCTAALAGDSALAAAERRIGRRPGARLVTPLLAVCGGAAAIGILVAHLSHPLALDGWVGLAGSLLLVIAAVAYHHLPAAATPSER